MSAEALHEEDRPWHPPRQPGLPPAGIREEDGIRDSLGRVIGSDEEQEAFETWLREFRRTGRMP